MDETARKTLEAFARRYDILVGVGKGLVATNKETAAITALLEENKRLKNTVTSWQSDVVRYLGRIDAALNLLTHVEDASYP